MSAVILFGAIAALRIGVSQLPDIDFPVISISIANEGASPEIIEAELLDPLEQALLQIEGIKQMKSQARLGTGSIVLDFEIDRDIDSALQEVQAALSSVRLPLGVDPPILRKQNPEDQPIMFMSVSSDGPMKDTIQYVEDRLLDEFRFLSGIGEVSIGGFSQRNLRIWPDPAKLRKYNLTVLDVVDAVNSQHVDSSAGQISNSEKERRIRFLGETFSPEEMQSVQILRRGGQIIHDQVIRIGDVAEVEDGLSDVRRMARAEGREAVSILVRKMRGSNEVKVAQRVTEQVDRLQDVVKKSGFDLKINVDFTKSTKAIVATTWEKLAIASVVTILVCFFFLGNLQSAVNVLFSIPTSVTGTFIIIFLAGYTFNLFTLLALILSVSIVVDDAIMLLENIVRHHRMGKTPYQAALDGSVEVLPAAIAATFAVVAVFLPVLFISGVTGLFFFQFGVTMTAAVLLSLVEAITITPVRAASLLRQTGKGGSQHNRFEVWLDEKFESLQEIYRRSLEPALRHSIWILIGSIGLFMVSLLSFSTIRKEFVPSQDQNLIFISGQTEPGSSLERTYQSALAAEQILKEIPEVQRFFVSVGAGGPNAEVNQFSIPVFLKPRTERKKGHLQLIKEFRSLFSSIPSARFTVRDLSTRGLTSGRPYPISFNISGPNLQQLQDSARELIEHLESNGLALDLDTDLKSGFPEIQIEPERARLAQFNVSIETIASTLATAVAGVRINRFSADGKRYDIRVKLTDSILKDPDQLKEITVRNTFGNLVRLGEVARFKEVKNVQSINRLNRQRSIGVFGNLASGVSQLSVLEKAQSWAFDHLERTYKLTLEGAAAGLSESLNSMIWTLIMGLIVAYMVLAIQFNSYSDPISILLALPFSLSGALIPLWLFDVSLNLFSFIGIVVLMGIAKKNSILLVEFTKQTERKTSENSSSLSPEGRMDRSQALLAACPVRLRPILMTSVATIIAALPLVFGSSIGQETRTPLGLTIIGGTFVSTLFTLYVVPCAHLLLGRFTRTETASTQSLRT